MNRPPYVVHITGKTTDGRPLSGTGFLVSPSGHVATCWHVVSEAAEIRVQVASPPGVPWLYEVLGKSTADDLVVLQSKVPLNEPTHYASLNRNWRKTTQVGHTVAVWGCSNAAAYGGAQRFECKISGFSPVYGRIGLNGDLNPGDSGGPLIDQADLVIGLAQVRDQNRNGQGMAIPVAPLLELLQPFGPPASPSAGSPKWGVPYRPSRFFTGRKAELQALHEVLAQDPAQLAIRIVTAQGGQGKTQFALAYAEQYGREYRAVLWLKAETEPTIRAGFSEHARMLQVASDGQGPDDAFRAVIQWLESDDHSPWLLIFDNATQPKLVSGFLPRGRGHILITSRSPDSSVGAPFELPKLSPDDAADFLKLRTGQQDQRGDFALLAEKLDGLPLALEQAGGYIVTTNTNAADYLQRYEQERLALLSRYADSLGDREQSVATTWDLNFREVEQRSAAAADLLRASAFLSADQIPLELLVKGGSALGPALATALRNAVGQPSVVGDLLEPLQRFSLIRLERSSDSISVHRLVQLVLKEGMSAPAQRQWAARIILAMSQTFPEPSYANWGQCKRLLLQARAAARHIVEFEVYTLDAMLLLNRAGGYLQQQGSYQEARLFHERAVAVQERYLEAAQAASARVLNDMGSLHYDLGANAEAEKLYLRALEIREKSLGPSHPDVAQTLGNLAALHHRLGRDEQAEVTSVRALRIRERALGREHPDVAQSLSDLATLYEDLGEPARAEPLRRNALTIREIDATRRPLELAEGLERFGRLQDTLLRPQNAEPLLRRALALWEKFLEQDDPRRSRCLRNLAAVLQELGKDDEAAALRSRAVEFDRRAAGPPMGGASAHS